MVGKNESRPPPDGDGSNEDDLIDMDDEEFPMMEPNRDEDDSGNELEDMDNEEEKPEPQLGDALCMFTEHKGDFFCHYIWILE